MPMDVGSGAIAIDATAVMCKSGQRNVAVSDGQLVAQVIDWHEAGFDFADAFHLALSKSHDTFKTFDANFIKKARKHTDRRVERP